MSIQLRVNVNNSAGLLAAAGTGTTAAYGPGAKVRLERASAAAGPYAEILTLDLVSGTDQYVFWDPTGTSVNWYQTRVSNAAATTFSNYSEPFQATALTAYGTVDDLLETLPDSPDELDVSNWLADLLVAATAIINARIDPTGQRDFFRHPQVSGTETRYFRTTDSDRIIVPGGIVSLTLAEYASTFGGAFTALGAENTDWYLDDPITTRTKAGVVVTSYFSIRLASNGALARWYHGPRLGKLTGVFGWAGVPAIIETGALALAREMYAMQPTGRGSASSGAAGYGSFQVPELLPRPTYESINYGAHLIGHLFT